MGITTRNKRSSAINISSPWRGMLPAPSGSSAGSDRAEVAFLYRLDDFISVAVADLTLTGSDITFRDANVVTVDAGALTLSGSNILERDTIGITSADLTLTGSAITFRDANLVTVDAGALTLSGSSILELDTVGVVSANLTLTGSDISLRDANLVTVDAGALTLSGSSIIELDTIGVTAAALSLTGEDITVSDVVAGSESITVDAAELTLTGGDITVVDPAAASRQKDSDPDYWKMRGFRVEGGTFAEKLHADTIGALEEIFSAPDPVRAARPAARAVREYARASGALLSDDEVTALELVADQLRSAASQRLADAAKRSAAEGRALLIAHLMMQRDEEEALFVLGIY